MVPKVAGKGRSFMGAGMYYLHDKKAETSERVAFTYTVNLPTRDPEGDTPHGLHRYAPVRNQGAGRRQHKGQEARGPCLLLQPVLGPPAKILPRRI
ncbi:hypothetical protein GGD63_008102 [Bradyrhizobium sp. cir1]|nr:hypothetical protein [Bradyrhizobium sp. cir1]